MILVIVSVIAKALSFIVRIMLARTLSPSAMNYYTLAAPTMVFFITPVSYTHLDVYKRQ